MDPRCILCKDAVQTAPAYQMVAIAYRDVWFFPATTQTVIRTTSSCEAIVREPNDGLTSVGHGPVFLGSSIRRCCADWHAKCSRSKGRALPGPSLSGPSSAPCNKLPFPKTSYNRFLQDMSVEAPASATAKQEKALPTIGRIKTKSDRVLVQAFTPRIPN